jgi:hypothetical protein
LFFFFFSCCGFSSSSSSFFFLSWFFFFFLRLFLSSTFSLMLFSYVEIPLFLSNFQEGSTEIEMEKKKKKKKTSIYNFFADNPDQDIEI